MKIISIFLLSISCCSLSAQNKQIQVNQLSRAEEEIWALEKDYISYFEEVNYKAILSLYHSQFLGWPDSELHPAGKERAAKYLEEKHPATMKVTYNIRREGIRIVGDIAISHYLVVLSWKDEQGIEQKGESRITHTWIKENSEWKILGGMSNRQ